MKMSLSSLACLWLALAPAVSAAPGDVDPQFDPDSDQNGVLTLPLPDTSLVVAGDFGVISGVARALVSRFTAAGVIDPFYNPNLTHSGPSLPGVYCGAALADGKVISAVCSRGSAT